MAKAALTTTEVKVDPELRAKIAVRAYVDSIMALVNSDHLKLTEQEKHDLILQEKNLDELKKGECSYRGLLYRRIECRGYKY